MNAHVGWPQAIYLLLNILCLALVAATPEHERKPINPAGATLMWIGVTLPLLYWGGFFA